MHHQMPIGKNTTYRGDLNGHNLQQNYVEQLESGKSDINATVLSSENVWLKFSFMDKNLMGIGKCFLLPNLKEQGPAKNSVTFSSVLRAVLSVALQISKSINVKAVSQMDQMVR